MYSHKKIARSEHQGRDISVELEKSITMQETISQNPVESKKARMEYRWRKLRDMLVGQLYSHDDREFKQYEKSNNRISRLIAEDQSAFAHQEFEAFLFDKTKNLIDSNLDSQASKLDYFLSDMERLFGTSNVELFVFGSTEFTSVLESALQQFEKAYNSYSSLLDTSDGVSDCKSFGKQTSEISRLLDKLNEYYPQKYDSIIAKWNSLFFKLMHQSVENFLQGLTTTTALQDRVFSELFTKVLGYHDIPTMVRRTGSNAPYKEIPNFSYRDSVQDVRTKLKIINDLINRQEAEI